MSAAIGLRRPELLRDAGLIGGQWVAAENGATLDVTDPASNAAIGTVPAMAGVEVSRLWDADALVEVHGLAVI